MNFPANAFRGEELLTFASTDAGGEEDSPPSPPCCESLPFAHFCADQARVQAWRRLERAAALPTQSHGFAAALAGTLLVAADLQIFFAAGADGLAALLPLCRAPRPWARWRTIGAREIFEPGDALCRDSEAAPSLAEAIVRERKAVELDRIPAGSPLVPALQAAMRGKGWTSVRPATATPTITLDERWKDPASCFNSGRRSDLRRAGRRAREFGAMSFDMLSPGPGEFDALFDEAILVEGRSWKREAGTAIAVDRAKEDFFREFFRTASAEGTLRIAFLRIDGRVIAMQLAIESLDRYWLFKIGFDERFGRCSPGNLLMLETIGWAARKGLRAYELLGNFDPWIAQFWTQERHEHVRLRTYPYNAQGAFAFAADAWTWLRRSLARSEG